MVDTKHNEFTFIKKMIIALIIVNLTTTLFAYMTAGNLLGVECTITSSNPACQINSQQGQINKTATNLAHSFDNSTTSPIKPIPAPDFGSGVLNDIIVVPNVVFHTGEFIYNVLTLFGSAVYLLIFMLFILIPALFLSINLGVLSGIFAFIYGMTVVIIIGYALYLLLNRIRG